MNNAEKYICIGDVHGRYDLLDELLKKIGAECFIDADIEATGHKFVFLGDMVDRGPDSYLVVDRIKNMCEIGNAIALRGNHEDMMIDYFNNKRVDPNDVWLWNGGTKTVRSYCSETKEYGSPRFFQAFGKSGHAAWIKSLPYYFETDKVFFSHAPVPKLQYRRSERDYRLDTGALTWSWHGNYGVKEDEFAMDHGKIAVCGHVHALQEGILEPRIYPHIVYADTGCGCAEWGPLTAVFIEDGKFVKYIQAALAHR